MVVWAHFVFNAQTYLSLFNNMSNFMRKPNIIVTHSHLNPDILAGKHHPSRHTLVSPRHRSGDYIPVDGVTPS